MYKHSPSRNQRSKGIKVKHVLQVCLLVAVCFWLIYQVKHSHDKKREFDDNVQNSLATEQKDGVVKLGRKDLNPKMEEKVIKTGKQDEEEEDETAVEEEENKHEETEEQDDNKTDEKEEEEEDVDEGRDVGEEIEIDDHDKENSDTDNDQEIDLVDDDKERENVDEQELQDKDPEGNNGQTENDSGSQEHFKKGDITNTREENYKADDASSAVTHVTQITIPDNQTMTMGKSNQQPEVSQLEQRKQSINPDEVGAGQNPPVKVEGGETANNGSYLPSTSIRQNETATATLNRTEESIVHKNNNNSTAVRIEPEELPLVGRNRIFSEQNQDENVVEGHKNPRQGSKSQMTDNKLEGNSTLLGKNDPRDFGSTINIDSKDIDPSLEESKKSDGIESSISKVQSNVAANLSAKTEEAFNDTKDNGAAGINEKLDESNSEISDELQVDPIDSSDTTNSLEEKYIQ
ncbi:hypothetical protein LIER_42277 [Lithospermum erythrorhizon]|uniref:Uncharacterized protein n=1 Tax=Lithospermum erythrorhizon TaxID=34254 RepID=A0AAV3RMB6_LITER